MDKPVSVVVIAMTIFFGLVAGCHEGLSPEDEVPTVAYFGGKIRVNGGLESWPDTTEMFGIRVAGFKTSEPSSLLQEVVGGNAYLTFTSLGEYFDEIEYVIKVQDAPVTLKYTVVAWQFEDSLSSQRVAAVYGGETPVEFELMPGDSLTDIDFEIDFDDLPPQPF